MKERVENFLLVLCILYLVCLRVNYSSMWPIDVCSSTSMSTRSAMITQNIKTNCMKMNSAYTYLL